MTLAFAALVHRAADAVRGSPVERLVEGEGGPPPRTSTPGFTERAATLAGTTLSGGHHAEILVDATLWDRLLADLAAARRSITFLGYYCDEGRLVDELARVLADRARGGVQVLFLGDDFGCGRALPTIRESLEVAGATVASFRPVRWYSLHKAQHRMHARSIVLDGVVGYTGGFGVADKWVEDAPGEPRWRDTGVRFTGPAVRAMQAQFLAAWAEATGELRHGDALLPDGAVGEAGDGDGVVAGYLHSAPGIGTTAAERYLAVTLSAAERTLFVANSYFVPTPSMRDQLVEAAARGVDVRLLLPGERVDVRTTRYAGRGSYAELLAAGVRIFEYQPAMMHAKTLVADGRWLAVGTLNLDNRSLRLNDESAFLAHDPALGSVMDSLFLADLARAREVTQESHRARPLHERLLEWAALRVAAWL